MAFVADSNRIMQVRTLRVDMWWCPLMVWCLLLAWCPLMALEADSNKVMQVVHHPPFHTVGFADFVPSNIRGKLEPFHLSNPP